MGIPDFWELKRNRSHILPVHNSIHSQYLMTPCDLVWGVSLQNCTSLCVVMISVFTGLKLQNVTVHIVLFLRAVGLVSVP
jgi:hypothetical protein